MARASEEMASLFLRAASAAVLVFGTCSDAVASVQSVAMIESAGAAAGTGAYSSDELASILAPIALYPDELLAQTLMAATYPDDIKAAANWLNEGGNRSLKGEALKQALSDKPWNLAVKSLVPFPQVLEQLSSHPDWTQELAYAVGVQEGEVMVAVQKLRSRAKESGHLQSGEQIRVSTEPTPAPAPDAPPPPADMPQQTIMIEPANPEAVYVPAYDPTVVYGGWGYSYPPYYWPPPYGYYPGAALAAGMVFGAAIAGGLWGWAGAGWGWGGSNINVNVNRYNNLSGAGGRWNGGANGAWGNRPG